MSKNIYGISFVVIVVAAAIHYFFFYNPCQQPSKIDVALIQLSCARSINMDRFREAFCRIQHGTSDCEITEADIPVAQELFLKHVNKCALEELKTNNKCTDKYEELK